VSWPPRVTALDLSLTGTGICHIADSQVRHLETVKTKVTGHQRMQEIGYAIGRWTGDLINPHLVVIEGPSYGSQGGQSGHHERAGLWWITAHRLWRNGVPYAVISPNARAKYATGKGNANKAEVLTAAIKRWGHLVDIGDDNQADALILAAMACDHLESPLAPVPAVNRAALVGVTWPDLMISGAIL
jgi:Holliday junction resolvasome RuvABC endonuclease subunit